METTRLPSAVETYLENNRQELVEFADRLVGFDTQNPPGRTAEAIEWIDQTLDHPALDADRYTVDPQKPNVAVTLPGETDRTLCLNGHVDTVPFDASGWTHDPLGSRDGDRLYGRGTTDMKGAVAAMMQVLLAYARTETTPPVDVQLVVVSDEERRGEAGLPTVLEAPTFAPDACVVGETTSRNGRYSVSVADRGSVWVTLKATGVAAHGSRPMIGTNAIDRLYEAVTELRTGFGERELSIAAAMDEIIEESVQFYEPEAGADATRRLYRYPTINLGTIEGGTAINTVPATAEAEVDVRVTAGVDVQDALESIRDRLDAVAGVEITDLSWSEGSYERHDTPLVEATTEAAECVVDDPVYRRSATGGGDAKTFRHEGIPTVEFGFGTQTAHSTDEYTTVDALVRNVTSYALLPICYRRSVVE